MLPNRQINGKASLEYELFSRRADEFRQQVRCRTATQRGAGNGARQRGALTLGIDAATSPARDTRRFAICRAFCPKPYADAEATTQTTCRHSASLAEGRLLRRLGERAADAPRTDMSA